MIIDGIYKSLIRYCHGMVDVIQVAAPTTKIQYWAWEKRGEEQALPPCDLFGLAGWDFRDNLGLWEIHVGFNYSSFADANLFREAEVLDILYKSLARERKIPLRDTITGDPFSELLVENFQFMPMSQSKLRNYRPISVDLRRTGPDSGS